MDWSVSRAHVYCTLMWHHGTSDMCWCCRRVAGDRRDGVDVVSVSGLVSFGRQMARPARRTWILYAARWQDDRSDAWPHQYVPVVVVIIVIVVIIIVIIIVVVVIVVAQDDEVSLSAIGIRRWVWYGRCVGAAFSRLVSLIGTNSRHD